MNLKQTELLTNHLMAEHGLDGWTFVYNKRKVAFGVCKYVLRRIELSTKLVELNDFKNVLDTILHEIAHAKLGRGVGHGWEWRRMAKSIGCNGERCYSSNTVNTPKGEYEFHCEKCGGLGIYRHRKMNTMIYKHTRCGGKLYLQRMLP